MAKKKESKQLILHCKCDACTHWEVIYDKETKIEYLKCKSCGVEIGLYELTSTPHAGIHWEKFKG